MRTLRVGIACAVLAIATILGAATATAAPPLGASALHRQPTTNVPDDGATTDGETDGSATTTWGVQPSNPNQPGTRAAFEYDLAPGASVSDAVRVTNFSESPLTLEVYASDAFNTEKGGFDLLAGGTESVDVGAWVDLETRQVTIPPRESVDVPFVLTVPTSAEPGDHAGGIVASISRESTDADGNLVTVDHRVGSRIYLRVDGPLRPALTIEMLDIDYDATLNPLGRGSATVTYTVRNSGNIRLSAQQQLEVSAPLGLMRQRPTLEDLPELLPGSHLTTTVVVDDVAPTARVSAELDLVPQGADGAIDPVAATTSTWAMPWASLASLAVVASLIVGVLRLRGSRKVTAPRVKRRSAVAAIAVVSFAVLAALAALPLAAQSSGNATVTVSPASGAVGDRVAVTVDGWPAGPVSIELCGNDAQRGSADCDVAGGAAGIVRDGTATMAITLGAPPVGCPCVIRARGSGAQATVPVAVAGAGDVVASPDANAPELVRRLQVDGVRVVDDGDLPALFGAAARRELELTVHNSGTVEIGSPALSVSVSRGDSTPSVVRTPPIDPIAPGESVELSVPFHLPTLAMGTYRVTGQLSGADDAVAFAATTDTTPWGLLIIGGLAAYLVLLRLVVWAILRRRRRRAEATLQVALAEPALFDPDEPIGGDDPVELAGASVFDAEELKARFTRPPKVNAAPQPGVATVAEPSPSLPPPPIVVPPEPVVVLAEPSPSLPPPPAAPPSTPPSPRPAPPRYSVPVPSEPTHVRWDAFGGVTLDSVLGALIDAGASVDAVQRQLDGLQGSTCRLRVEQIDPGSSGVAATLATIDVSVPDADDPAIVRWLLERCELSVGTAVRLGDVFAVLADAEAAVRRQGTRDEVRVDLTTFVGLVACCAALEALGVVDGSIGPVSVSTLTTASGDGPPVPSPSPVAAEVLRRHGVVWRPGPWEGMQCTPSGLAVLVATATAVAPPALVTSSIGYGVDAGNPAGGPSLRALLALRTPPTAPATTTDPRSGTGDSSAGASDAGDAPATGADPHAARSR